MSASASAVPPSPSAPQPVATQVYAGTLPAVGRTTSGLPGRKTAAVGIGVVGAVALAVVAGSVVALKRGAAQHDDPPTAAAVPVATPLVSQQAPPQALPIDLPKSADGKPVAAAAPVTMAQPTPPVLPSGALPAKRPSPIAHPMPATPAPAPAPTPSAPAVVAPASPAAAKCDPPYYFDANGNRLFKKECL